MTTASLHGSTRPGPHPPRRRLRTALVALAVTCVVLVAIPIGVGWWIRGEVERAVADRIDQQVPGANARVGISSFPFIDHLAASGTILELSVHLGQVSAGPFTYNGVHVTAVTFDDVDIHIDGLHIQREQLPHRKVVIDRIRRATVTATLGQRSLDRSVGLPLTLGEGAVGIGGLSLPATISIGSRRVTVTVPHQISLSFEPPPLKILPCVGAVVIHTGALRVSCTLDHLPPVLADTVFRF